MEVSKLETDEVMVLETNLDNLSGEVLGDLMERLFQAGALDVTYTPMQMKKNRPATQISVIAPPALAEQLSLLLLRETTTLGVRMSRSAAPESRTPPGGRRDTAGNGAGEAKAPRRACSECGA